MQLWSCRGAGAEEVKRCRGAEVCIGAGVRCAEMQKCRMREADAWGY